ncbi:MAG TPA: DUF3144 domain-containing protein [Thermohalobaculum sp.]|nr:DUF3144 domain-containing protein [Thermohalobaculum sp.]
MAAETGSNGDEGGTPLSPEEQRAFFDMADQFLAVANRLTDEAPVARISAAMMFATARFNAFLAQTQGLPPGEVDEETARYFTREYETMLRENLAQVLSARQVKGM